jgi:diguanylate cyclase (GGDEF)-like protein
MSDPTLPPDDLWFGADDLDRGLASDQAHAESLAATVAAEAVAEAELAAQAVTAAQEALQVAARTVAEAADVAARTVAQAAAAAAEAVAAAVEDKAAVVAAAAEAAAEARRREVSLTHDALHDELTGLPNRRLLTDRLTQALARSKRTSQSVAVLFLDLDNFKAFNDSAGHQMGDQVLVGVAERLKSCVRDSDTCLRFGGDEFVVICEDIADVTHAGHLAERLRGALAAGVSVGDRSIRISASIGTVVSTRDSKPLALLHDADAAMYRAKAAGRPALHSGAPASEAPTSSAEPAESTEPTESTESTESTEPGDEPDPDR